jgi:hypothetical protein
MIKEVWGPNEMPDYCKSAQNIVNGGGSLYGYAAPNSQAQQAGGFSVLLISNEGAAIIDRTIWSQNKYPGFLYEVMGR